MHSLLIKCILVIYSSILDLYSFDGHNYTLLLNIDYISLAEQFA